MYVAEASSDGKATPKNMPSSGRGRLPSTLTSTSPPPRIRTLCQTGLTLASWYCISSAIILTTKWLFNSHFPHPLTVTTFSNSITTVWALLISRIPRFRPEPLTRRQFIEYVLPIGITTALEIGFSNIALKLLTVSFGTILKGGAPIFTMFWGLLFRVETFSFNLLLSLLTIAFGIALASLGEGHSFSLTGFILQLLSTALGGLRWAMTHVLLKGADSDAMPPLTATLYTSPTTALCVLPFAVGLEAVPAWDRISGFDAAEFRTVLLTMLLVASLVFFLLISEYWLVNATSSLALSVAGVFKELLTIGGGIYLFAEHITFLNTVGFIICQVGIFAYMYLRYDPQNSHSYTRAPTSSSTTDRHSEPPNNLSSSADSHHQPHVDTNGVQLAAAAENARSTSAETTLAQSEIQKMPDSVNFSIDDEEPLVSGENDSGTANAVPCQQGTSK